VRRFERLIDLGLPREALALWRGPPLDADGVRAVAGRELIPREWAAALPERPYRVVCTKR
jgi:hypothetical protein